MARKAIRTVRWWMLVYAGFVFAFAAAQHNVAGELNFEPPLPAEFSRPDAYFSPATERLRRNDI